MRGASEARSRGVICLESRTPARVRASPRCASSFGRMTAPTATGPARAPRPASSNPATWSKPLFQSPDSKKVVGLTRAIQSPPGVGVDEEDILDHAQGVAQRADFAIR